MDGTDGEQSNRTGTACGPSRRSVWTSPTVGRATPQRTVNGAGQSAFSASLLSMYATGRSRGTASNMHTWGGSRRSAVGRGGATHKSRRARAGQLPGSVADMGGGGTNIYPPAPARDVGPSSTGPLAAGR